MKDVIEYNEASTELGNVVRLSYEDDNVSLFVEAYLRPDLRIDKNGFSILLVVKDERETFAVKLKSKEEISCYTYQEHHIATGMSSTEIGKIVKWLDYIAGSNKSKMSYQRRRVWRKIYWLLNKANRNFYWPPTFIGDIQRKLCSFSSDQLHALSEIYSKVDPYSFYDLEEEITVMQYLRLVHDELKRR